MGESWCWHKANILFYKIGLSSLRTHKQPTISVSQSFFNKSVRISIYVFISDLRCVLIVSHLFTNTETIMSMHSHMKLLTEHCNLFWARLLKSWINEWKTPSYLLTALHNKQEDFQRRITQNLNCNQELEIQVCLLNNEGQLLLSRK